MGKQANRQDKEPFRESEEQLNKLSRSIEFAPVSVVITNLDGKIEYVNSFFSTLTGYQSDEVIGLDPSVLQSGETPSETYPQMWETILKGETWKGEFINKKKNGELYIELAQISPVCDSENNITNFIAIKKDITERKRIEEELRISELRYRSLFEQTHDAVFILDLDGNHLTANRRAGEMLGYSLDELVPLSFNQVSAEVDHSSNILARLLAGEQVPIYERWFRKKGGEVFPVEVKAQLVRDGHGNPLHIQSVVRDITERKLSEDREQEQRVLAEALRDTAEALNSSLEMDNTLEKILDYVGQVIDYDAMSITWFEDDLIHVLRSRGFGLDSPEIFDSQTFPIDISATFTQLIKTRSPVVIPDIRNSSIWDPPNIKEWVRSHIKAPIIIKDKVAGSINLNSKTPGFYEDKHAGILQAFTNQVAIAMHNVSLYKEVETLATIDELTGLYNRRGFFEVCRREISRLHRFNRAFSVLFVDIDHFKRFNDEHGYNVGDAALKMVAESLLENSREIDFIGRYGGEELVVLLSELGQEDALEVAERMRKVIENLQVIPDQKDLGITVSIGVATLVPDPEKTIAVCAEKQKEILESLIIMASHALREAKQRGRNQIAVSLDAN